ncbi:histidine phosphatase family protein [Vibrio variabilis]|uniref:histidine phosphatase family protein n=1 Tax=Vibrio variabilis TaxID=990271 RepID=UPI000DD99732|nr:histidine phosphatase family protein [Vibrio variabilis]
MSNIHLIRHGETHWNLEHRAQGSMNSNLTERGKTQAREAMAKIEAVDFDVAYSSSSGRALETAKILLADMSTPIIELDELKEIDMGAWEGKTWSEIQSTYGEQYEQFWKRPSHYQPINGETFEVLTERAIDVFNHITSTNSDSNILIVSHAAFIKTLVTKLLSRPIDEVWDEPMQGILVILF